MMTRRPFLAPRLPHLHAGVAALGFDRAVGVLPCATVRRLVPMVWRAGR